MFDHFAVLHAFVQEFHSILHVNWNILCQIIIKNVKMNMGRTEGRSSITKSRVKSSNL